MTERSDLTEKKQNIFTQALKVVKGDNTTRLIQSFTEQVTMVIEGLYEDQQNLRKKSEDFQKEEDQRIQIINEEISVNKRNADKQLEEMEHKIEKIQLQIKELEKHKSGRSGFMNQLVKIVIIISVTAILVALITRLL